MFCVLACLIYVKEIFMKMNRISRIAVVSLMVATMFSGIMMSSVSATEDSATESSAADDSITLHYSSCKTLATAIQLAKFTFCLPDAPSDYPNITYKVEDTFQTVYANYTNSSGDILYTLVIEPGGSFYDLGGDEILYNSIKKLRMDGTEYKLYGPAKDKIAKVTWHKNNFNFAFVAGPDNFFAESTIKPILKTTGATNEIKTKSKETVTKCKTLEQVAKAAGFTVTAPASSGDFPTVNYSVRKASKKVDITYENVTGDRSFTVSVQPGILETDLSDEFKLYAFEQDLVKGKTRYHKYGASKDVINKVTWYTDGYNFLIKDNKNCSFTSSAVTNLVSKIKVAPLSTQSAKKTTTVKTTTTAKTSAGTSPASATKVTASASAPSTTTTVTHSTASTSPAAVAATTTSSAKGKTFTNLDDAIEEYGTYVFLPMSGSYTATSYVVNGSNSITINYKMNDTSGAFTVAITKGKWAGNVSSLPYKTTTTVKVEDGASDTGYRNYCFGGDTDGEWKMVKWSINDQTYTITASGVTFDTQKMQGIADFILVEP